MDPQLTSYFELADKIGVIVLGIIGFIALYKKWIVLGWIHEKCEQDRDELRTVVTTRAAKIESELEKIRANER
jgi:hypothetical protein